MILDSEDKVLGLGALTLAFCRQGEQRPAAPLTSTLVGGRGLQPSTLPNHKSNFSCCLQIRGLSRNNTCAKCTHTKWQHLHTKPLGIAGAAPQTAALQHPHPCASSCAREEGISPRSNRRKPFRRDAPPHQSVRRHMHLETPVWEDKEPPARWARLRERRRSRLPVRPAGSRALPGARAGAPAEAPRPRRPRAARAAAGHQLGIAERSCRLSSGGTALRVYMRNHMVTSSSWWAARRVTSSAVELPHPCEMQRGAGSSKAGCSGAWLLRQQAAGQWPLGKETWNLLALQSCQFRKSSCTLWIPLRNQLSTPGNARLPCKVLVAVQGAAAWMLFSTIA